MIVPNTPTPSRTLAVFDLDGTLVCGDTFLPFLISYARRHRRWRPLLTLPFWLGLYGCRILSDSSAKQRVLIAFLRGQALCYGVPVETLAAVAVREWIEERRRTIPTIQMVR